MTSALFANSIITTRQYFANIDIECINSARLILNKKCVFNYWFNKYIGIKIECMTRNFI